MRFDHEFPDVEQALVAARDFDAIEGVLQRLTRMVPALLVDGIRGWKLFSPRLDSALSSIPRRLGLTDVSLEKGQGNICILATRFYTTGGHSQVAADIVRLVGGERVTLIFTDIYRQLGYRMRIGSGASVADRFPHRAMVMLSAPTLTEKIVELYAVLAAIKPSRIFLMGNHMDPVAIAGAWPFRDVVDYVHHADFMPALGSSLRFSTHADLTYSCHLACREAGLSPVYAAMTAPRSSGSPTARPPRGERLTIATCGGLHKYRRTSRFRWSEYVVAALTATDGDFIHMGPIDETFTEEVSTALQAAGVDPERYRFVGVVADLQTALRDHGVDIYVSSYPEPGGRANLEAMMAGLPVIIPVEPEAGPLMVDRWPFAQATSVESPAELETLLRDPEGLLARVTDDGARAHVETERRRFEAYVAGSALESVGPNDRLPG